MIAVIADDFTGAAEIGGLGLRYGMTVEIETKVIKNSKADLLIIATDTRSLSKTEAANEIFKITRELKKIDADFIYKKTDSVMRGHVLEELLAVMQGLNINNVLLVPANPTFGRTISEGKYYINERLLHQTDFSQDPEFALRSSDVLELLGNHSHTKTAIVKRGDEFPQNTIAVGEAITDADLISWAGRINENVIPAGASGFFSAILESNGYKVRDDLQNNNLILGKNRLFVFGSSFSASRQAINEAKADGKVVSEIPAALFNNTGETKKLLNSWVEEVVRSYEKNCSIIVAINQPIVLKKKFAKGLREILAELVGNVLKKVEINELFIEGGATTYEIMRKANFIEFFPVQEIAPGVIRMQVYRKPGMYITIKPGSYSWPEIVWKIKN